MNSPNAIFTLRCLCCLLLTGAFSLPVSSQELISRLPNGLPASGASFEADVDGEGRQVVFASDAPDILSRDGDRITDVFRLDRSTGTLELLSPPLLGRVGDAASRAPSISDDGRRVVFQSSARNLVAAASDGTDNIFLWRQTGGTVELVSVALDGSGGDNSSLSARISGDGLVVAFESTASDLVAAPGPVGETQIFLRDLVAGMTLRIDPPIGIADESSRNVDLDATGRFVAFETSATNYVADDTNSFADVVVLDRTTGLFRRASVASDGSQANSRSSRPRLSADGRFVAFESFASNLTARDRNGALDVFVHDMARGETERVSLDLFDAEIQGASNLHDISRDGRFVLFSTAVALVPNDGNGAEDLWVRDRLLGTTALVSARDVGTSGSAATPAGSLNALGDVVVCESDAEDFLPAGDGNGERDIFAFDRDLVDLEARPPANALVVPVIDAGATGSLRLLGLDGRLDAPSLFPRASLRATTLDERGLLWVVDGRTLSLHAARDLSVVASRLATVDGIEPLHDIIASAGSAWISSGTALLRVGADGSTDRVDLGDAGISYSDVSLCRTTTGHVIVSASRDDGVHLIGEFRPDLELVRVFERAFDPVERGTFHRVACDSQGRILVRARRELFAWSPSGALLWSLALGDGRDLVVDAADEIWTLDGDELISIDGRGELLSRTSVDRDALGARLAIDGLGDLWVLRPRLSTVLRLSLGRRRDAERTLTRFAIGELPSSLPVGDLSGFSAANVAARDFDSDGDGFLDGAETDAFFNPFDASTPAASERLRGLVNLRASTTETPREVRLTWDSPVLYDRYHVLRDGRAIVGSPFAGELARFGVLDGSVPGGLHRYRVVGQSDGPAAGAQGGVAGLGGFDEQELLEEPFSLSEEVEISLGEGDVLACAVFDAEPEALARHPSNAEVVVALAGGTLLRLDADLQALDEEALPQDPFEEIPVRGMAWGNLANPDGQPLLHILLADGSVYRKPQGEDPEFLYELPVLSEEGPVGLALRGTDLFTLAGPGAECFIGYQGATGNPILDASLLQLLDAEIVQVAGIDLIEPGGHLLVGVGTGGSAIEAGRSVLVSGDSPDLQFTDGGTSLPLGALESNEISDLALASPGGLLALDRQHRRVCLLEATLPLAPRLLSVTPERGEWDEGPQLELSALVLGDDADDIDVLVDGLAIEPDLVDLDQGRIVLTLPALGRAAGVEIRVQNPAGFDADDDAYVFGFRRGNANNDARTDLSDAVFLLAFLFSGGDPVPCVDSADSDDSGVLDISDAIALLSHLFLGDPAPPQPFGAPGIDPTYDALPCGEE